MSAQENQKSPADVAADVFLFAPVGLALEVSKHLPELAKQGRERLRGPIAAAKFVSQMAATQGKKDLGEKFRKATEPYFGGPPSSSSPSATTTAATATAEPAHERGHEDAIPKSENLAVAGYDTLPASQILTHLEGLSQAELADVAAYERTHRGRKTILARIEELQANR